MKINLSEIARGRRIVAVAARDLSLTRRSRRPARRLLQRIVKRVLRFVR